jgi:hypothetical protein
MLVLVGMVRQFCINNGNVRRVLDENAFRETSHGTRFAISLNKWRRFACFAVLRNGLFRRYVLAKTARTIAGTEGRRSRRHISTALYFYGASKKSLHKPRDNFINI